MTLRAKLFLVLALTAVAATTALAWSVTRVVRQQLGNIDQQRSDAAVGQFQQELRQHGDEVVNRVQGVADAEATLRMALDLSRPQADRSVYANDARGLATARQLDFLELFADDGALISSAQWPERVGNKSDWIAARNDWNQQGFFLRRVELAGGLDVGLLAVRVVRVGEKNLYIVGGQRLDRGFLSALVMPRETRALLYRNLEASFVPSALTGVDGPPAEADRFGPIIESLQADNGRRSTEGERTIQWTTNAASVERFASVPLTGRQGELLSVLLVGSTQQELAALVSQIAVVALSIAGVGMLLAYLLSWWIAARLANPLERVTANARLAAAGAAVPPLAIPPGREVGRLTRAFNGMTERLADDRGRELQAERVASWREVARRITHELKEPLFSLQVTAEDLMRVCRAPSEHVDDRFFEAMTTLRGELQSFKGIVARFGDFAKTPQPQLQAITVNDMVRSAIKACEPQFSAIGRPPITPELFLDESAGCIHADPDLFRQVLDAVALRSLDSMPAGGTLTVRTLRKNRMVHIEVSDTGTGLTIEECSRTFTSYFSARQRGLGLATAQAIVSDHRGKMFVQSAPGAGTVYRIELPAAPGTTVPSLPSLPEPPAASSRSRDLPEPPFEEAEMLSARDSSETN